MPEVWSGKLLSNDNLDRLIHISKMTACQNLRILTRRLVSVRMLGCCQSLTCGRLAQPRMVPDGRSLRVTGVGFGQSPNPNPLRRRPRWAIMNCTLFLYCGLLPHGELACQWPRFYNIDAVRQGERDISGRTVDCAAKEVCDDYLVSGLGVYNNRSCDGFDSG